MKTSHCLRLLCFGMLTALLAVGSLAQQTAKTTKPTAMGALQITVRDGATHYAVRATIRLEGPKSVSAETDETGFLNLSLPAGRYTEEISAPGYETMKTWSNVEAGKSWPIGPMLDPVTPPEEDQSLDSHLKQGFTLLHAYAVDDRGQPVSGVRVRLQNAGDETTTDERGHYWLLTATPPDTARDTPGTDTLIAEKPGYKTVIHRNIIVAGEDGGGWFLDMEKGTGAKEFDDTHKLMKKGASTEEAAPELQTALENAPTALPSVSTAGTAPISLPSSIVVGSTCPTYSCPTPSNPNRTCPLCGSACTNPKPFPLESYVKQGLNQEWFSSWLTDSLEAGAVAYRTYGAYFVQHPGRSGSSNYDIRSDACNQAFVPTSKPPASTSSAATATAGIALTADGATAYFSEYASNTTGFGSCTSGQTGDGSSNWPCMADPIAFGTTGNGHGRGMSQYGSQWWASGVNPSGNPGVTYPRNWQCILDHYYNDNGNTTGEGTGLRTAFINGPGGDGPVVFAIWGNNTADIYTVNMDGSKPTRLTNDRTIDRQPSWSPGGAQIAFLGWSPDGGIWTMNSNGSNEAEIPGTASSWNPSWSPLGDKIAFDFLSVNGCGANDACLSTVKPDGSGSTRLNIFTDITEQSELAWSPDGTKIAYEYGGNIYIVGADGSGNTPIYLDSGGCTLPAPGCAGGFGPAWSPDGTRIAFEINDSYGGCGIYTMDTSGGNITQITAPSDCARMFDVHPSWSADGRTIIFASNRDDPTGYQLFSVPPYPLGAVTLLNNTTSSNSMNPDCRHCGRFDRF